MEGGRSDGGRKGRGGDRSSEGLGLREFKTLPTPQTQMHFYLGFRRNGSQQHLNLVLEISFERGQASDGGADDVVNDEKNSSDQAHAIKLVSQMQQSTCETVQLGLRVTAIVFTYSELVG